MKGLAHAAVHYGGRELFNDPTGNRFKLQRLRAPYETNARAFVGLRPQDGENAGAALCDMGSFERR